MVFAKIFDFSMMVDQNIEQIEKSWKMAINQRPNLNLTVYFSFWLGLNTKTGLIIMHSPFKTQFSFKNH